MDALAVQTETEALIDALPVPVRPKPFISKENAKALSLKAHQMRWGKHDRSQDKHAKRPIDPPTGTPDAYANAHLERVRAQLNRLHNMLAVAREEKRIRGLVASIAQLADVERELAGRPKPGTARPVEVARPSLLSAPSAPSAPALPTPAPQE